MRVMKLIDPKGHPLPPSKDGPSHDHASDDLRCISPYFGAYVAVGVVAVGLAAWKLLATVLT